MDDKAIVDFNVKSIIISFRNLLLYLFCCLEESSVNLKNDSNHFEGLLFMIECLMLMADVFC